MVAQQTTNAQPATRSTQSCQLPPQAQQARSTFSTAQLDCQLALFAVCRQGERWFASQDVDLQSLNRVQLLAMGVLARMQRHHSVIALGTAWQQVTDNAFTAQLAPLLLASAQASSQVPQVICWQAKVDQLVEVGQQHLLALERVRRLVRDRLSAPGLLPYGRPATASRTKMAVGALR